jgi:hypothetical protein
MLLIRKWRRGLYSSLILTLLSAIADRVLSADDDVPAGFKANRYQNVWERNPFTLVTPAAPQARATAFDKLILVSWLNDGGKDIVFVQNTDTSEVEKVTNDPNSNKLRLVEIHRNADPQKADVVLSDGLEQGSVKFRLEAPAVASLVPAAQPPPGTTTGAQAGCRPRAGPTRSRNATPGAPIANAESAASSAKGRPDQNRSRAAGSCTSATEQRNATAAGLRSTSQKNNTAALN